MAAVQAAAEVMSSYPESAQVALVVVSTVVVPLLALSRRAIRDAADISSAVLIFASNSASSWSDCDDSDAGWNNSSSDVGSDVGSDAGSAISDARQQLCTDECRHNPSTTSFILETSRLV